MECGRVAGNSRSLLGVFSAPTLLLVPVLESVVVVDVVVVATSWSCHLRAGRIASAPAAQLNSAQLN